MQSLEQVRESSNLPEQSNSTTSTKPIVETKTYTLVNWNIDGLRENVFQSIRAFLEVNPVSVLCLNETKKKESDLKAYFQTLTNYNYVINSNIPAHYHGVAMLIRKDIFYEIVDFSMNCSPRYDTKSNEAGCGRILAVQLDRKLNVITVYSPNSGTDYKNPLKNLGYRINQWDPALFEILRRFALWMPSVMLGDINVAPEEIDVSHPKALARHAGFTTEERNSFRNFMSNGTWHVGESRTSTGGSWVDIWREQHPGVKGYSFRGYTGYRYRWRLDNCLVTKNLRDKVSSSFILENYPADVDHVPIGVTLSL